jgi:hypothetical protein
MRQYWKSILQEISTNQKHAVHEQAKSTIPMAGLTNINLIVLVVHLKNSAAW